MECSPINGCRLLRGRIVFVALVEFSLLIFGLRSLVGVGLVRYYVGPIGVWRLAQCFIGGRPLRVCLLHGGQPLKILVIRFASVVTVLTGAENALVAAVGLLLAFGKLYRLVHFIRGLLICAIVGGRFLGSEFNIGLPQEAVRVAVFIRLYVHDQLSLRTRFLVWRKKLFFLPFFLSLICLIFCCVVGAAPVAWRIFVEVLHGEQLGRRQLLIVEVIVFILGRVSCADAVQPGIGARFLAWTSILGAAQMLVHAEGGSVIQVF